MRLLETNDWILLNSIIYKIYTTEDINAMYARNVLDVKEEDDYAAAGRGIDLTAQFFGDLGLPHTLSEVGIDDSQFALMAEEAVRTSGLSTRSYVKLTARDVEKIYRMCL